MLASYSLGRSCRLCRKHFRHGGKHCFPLLIAGYQSSPCLSRVFPIFFSLTATMRGRTILTGKASLMPFVDSLLPKAFVNVKDFFKVSGIFFLTLCGHSCLALLGNNGCPVFPFMIFREQCQEKLFQVIPDTYAFCATGYAQPYALSNVTIWYL